MLTTSRHGVNPTQLVVSRAGRTATKARTGYPQAWSRYGFVDAFNPLKNWYDNDVVGIDTGITMLMAENLRTSFVWETFMKNPKAQRGMAIAGFKAYQPGCSMNRNVRVIDKPPEEYISDAVS